MVYKISVYISGLFFLALGTNLAILSNLGVSPTGSVPYALNQLTGIELGLCSALVYTVYVGVQKVLLGAKFEKRHYLQLAFVLVFGYLVTATSYLTGLLTASTLPVQLVYAALSIWCTATGFVLHISANIIPLPPDGLVSVLSTYLSAQPLHQIKVYFDIGSVCLCAVMTLVGLGCLRGIGIGTLLSALLVGRCIPLVKKVAHPVLVRLQ